MEIKIFIRPSGEVEVSVDGVMGESCIKLTEFLEKALGEVANRDLKSAYYEKTPADQKLPLKNEY